MSAHRPLSGVHPVSKRVKLIWSVVVVVVVWMNICASIKQKPNHFYTHFACLHQSAESKLEH
jgi:hypothetical protein